MAILHINLEIEQGASFSRTFTWKDADNNPKDLTGCHLRMMVRRDYADAIPLLSLSDTAGGLSIFGPPVNGQFKIDLTAQQTAALDFSTALYDLEIEDGTGTVVRALEGMLILSREVTR
jgi:hypothetical protein